MLLHDFKVYVNAASDDQEIGVVIRSIETGDEIATTFDVVVDINGNGDLMICTVF